MWRRGRGYDHLFSRDSQKAERERDRGEEAVGPLGLRRSEKNGPSECWPNYFLLGQHKNARRGNGRIGQKWAWEQYGFISFPLGTFTFK